MAIFNAQSMPKALVSGQPLPHEGSLSDDEVRHLAGLGYDVIDVRQTFGTRQVELLLQAFMLGTIPVDGRFKVVAEARKVWADISKEEAEGALESIEETVDAVTLLTAAVEGAIKPPAKKRRGRPPGRDR